MGKRNKAPALKRREARKEPASAGPSGRSDMAEVCTSATKNRWGWGASLLIMSMALGVGTANAQQAQAPAQPAAPAASSDETIVVTGFRGSLAASLNVKRNANGFVDAITSEDIGK